MTAPAIAFSHVTKRYGAQTALGDVSLAVEPGECLALIGHNGAGKTTLMKLSLGLIRPSKGEVRVLGVDPAEARARELGRVIGFLPESITFHDAMTGREALAFYARLKSEPVSRNEELLDRVGLTAAADKRVKTYSKGMRQRLGLAQALLGRPRLLLLDEPTTGLDPVFRHSFYDLLHEFTARGTTVLLSSHALTELAARTDRVAIVNGGRLVAHGSLAELSRAARLAARVRISVPAGQAARVATVIEVGTKLARVNDRSVELVCPLEEKLALLRRIESVAALIDDIEIASPGLDEVFAHFTGIEGRA
ncbi:MAG TPA: ABC transporter ATP-binding protein [Alphaproteobacteria bacterium]|nr:ABC transporter ATP-binding protein [Alphaproteobacteria bacterium]